MVVHLAVLAFVSPMAPMPVSAEIIDTATALSIESRGSNLERVTRALDREHVRERLLALGVDRAAIEGRLDALTDRELADLAQRVDSAPAGGDLLAVVGAVFVVLLILEVVGVIDIFKTVGPARR